MMYHGNRNKQACHQVINIIQNLLYANIFSFSASLPLYPLNMQIASNIDYVAKTYFLLVSIPGVLKSTLLAVMHTL